MEGAEPRGAGPLKQGSRGRAVAGGPAASHCLACRMVGDAMAGETVREASCSCGKLTIKLSGEPEYVSSCACQACQRRTGSAFGVTAFFQEAQMVGEWGESSVFERVGGSGQPMFFRFCPNCGST